MSHRRKLLRACHRSGIVRAAVVAVILASFLVAVEPRSSLAQQPKPLTNWSFYVVSTSTSQAGRLGCNQGRFDTDNGRKNSLVILDFGGMRFQGSVEGTEMVQPYDAFMSYSQIEAYAREFARQYYVCTGSNLTSILTLAIGTSNFWLDGVFYRVDFGGGRSWGQLVTRVRNWVGSSGYSSQVRIIGASDIETSWSTNTRARAWVDGFEYDAVTGIDMLNYGSADGCPDATYSNGTCNNGWRQYDVWYVSRGAPDTRSVPQIYFEVNARQWAMISRYAATYRTGKIYFMGVLNEYPGSSTPDQAWNWLRTEINRYSSTASSIAFSCEIRYSNDV